MTAAECMLHPATAMPDARVVERLQQLQTSLISDVFDRWSGALDLLPTTGLRPGQVVAGPAFTVRTRPGDNLVVHKALDLARPGEVLVVAAGGHRDRAIIGGLMGHYAASQGIAALIIDGAIRDKSALNREAPPVFSAGVCQLGPYKDGPGELRAPVSMGGVVVKDGDMAIGDEDGVTFIPRNRLEEILRAAEDKRTAEIAEAAAIAAGSWTRDWVEELVLRRPDTAVM